MACNFLSPDLQMAVSEDPLLIESTHCRQYVITMAVRFVEDAVTTVFSNFVFLKGKKIGFTVEELQNHFTIQKYLKGANLKMVSILLFANHKNRTV